MVKPHFQFHQNKQIKPSNSHFNKPLRIVPNVKPNSLVHRFISSGKKGHCSLCKRFCNKLEAHHIKYSPEIVISLCHECHHKVHFWPLRLSSNDKFLLFSKVVDQKKALELSKKKDYSIKELASLIAPSRNAFVRSQQSLNRKIDVRKHTLKKRMLFKSLKINKNKFK